MSTDDHGQHPCSPIGVACSDLAATTSNLLHKATCDLTPVGYHSLIPHPGSRIGHTMVKLKWFAVVIRQLSFCACSILARLRCTLTSQISHPKLPRLFPLHAIQEIKEHEQQGRNARAFGLVRAHLTPDGLYTRCSTRTCLPTWRLCTWHWLVCMFRTVSDHRQSKRLETFSMTRDAAEIPFLDSIPIWEGARRLARGPTHLGPGPGPFS